MAKPVMTFNCGTVTLCVWENTHGENTIQSITIQRNYKDKDGKWQSTSSFKWNDLEKVRLVMNEALISKYVRKNNVEQAPKEDF